VRNHGKSGASQEIRPLIYMAFLPPDFPGFPY